jgi:GT2 family glycosyltransferase
VKLFVIMACHNRRELTLASVKRAQASADRAKVPISFTVFDDASTDGTAAALSQLPVSLQILAGDGSAFWAKSMAQAESAVLRDADDDSNYIVWLNDDVQLDEGAFSALIEISAGAPRSVVVGATRDPMTGIVTYSGMRRSRLHPLKFSSLNPTEYPQLVDAFNGNLVLVPAAIARRLGGMDGGFSHALADIDYGLRCGRAGVNVLLAPSTYGTCPRNPPPVRGAVWQDWLAFTGPKGGGNYQSVRRILRKSNPRSWRFFIAATYGLWWIRRATLWRRPSRSAG